MLDELMPLYDVRASYDTVVEAPVTAVYRAVLETDLAESFVSRLLMAIRSLGRQAPWSFRFGELPARGAFFALANDPPREVVAGVVGRFWAHRRQRGRRGPLELRRALPPGMAKAAWNFRVDDHATGARLTTETRVLCADDDSRRSFLRYWTWSAHSAASFAGKRCA